MVESNFSLLFLLIH
uniref:Uncharacterized protein n=1 Tax=Rhizophora mucronata TaxID=61149 RepID=A0A2P2NPN9_RHIMU